MADTVFKRVTGKTVAHRMRRYVFWKPKHPDMLFHVQLYMKKHVRMLGLPEDVTPHTMRHCFACHALEDGVSHTFIQQLLGHRSPDSTDVYLQMTTKALMGIRSPFDTFERSSMEVRSDGR